MSPPTVTTADPAAHADGTWTWICRLEEILPDTGVAAIVGGHQVAVFRLRDGRLLAIGNHDPCSGTNVLARGIVGDVNGRPVVTSPLHKQRFDLTSGACLDADARVATYPVRCVDGRVEVSVTTS